MGFEGKILAIFLLGIASTASSINTEFQTSLNNFNQGLFSKLLAVNANKNIIYSPFSIQTSLAMTRMGADGQTAVEMDQGLGFTGQTPESVADNYYALLGKYENGNILTIANKVYVKDGYQLQDNYKQLLTAKFFSSAENINFGESEKAASAINTWVESKTDNKIKDLISPDSLDDEVHSVLVSAIHFNGKWAKAFGKERTQQRNFFINGTHSLVVSMMCDKGTYDNGLVDDIKSNVLRLPYKDSDLSMFIFLPYVRNGWPKLEKRLKQFQFKSLQGKLKPVTGTIFVPKFKAEFEIELNGALKKMGMKRMFNNADFGKMMKSSAGLSVSKVIHKAAIEVNEEGTEAAAATAVEHDNRDMGRWFEPNYPFVYAIVNEDYVPLFQGTYFGV